MRMDDEAKATTDVTDITKLTDSKLSALIENRWKSSETLWKTVEAAYKSNKKIWENKPDWVDTVPRKKSKARDNRSFLATESVINTLTGRPSKPNVIPASDTNESAEIADDLQEFFLAKYRDLQIKSKMRRGLRYLKLARIICLKIFWNHEIDDFDVEVVDPKNIRLYKKATNCFNNQFAIEKIPDKPLIDLIAMFPDKEDVILREYGQTKEQILLDNPEVEYYEAWIGDYFCVKYGKLILQKGKHPFWDFDGVPMSANEMMKFKGAKTAKERSNVTKDASKYASARKGSNNAAERYQSYLYNYMDKPCPPYIFGTVLALENKPVGDTSLLEQVEPLQIEIDKRKRQISDNAQAANGRTMVDTSMVKMTKADAQAAKSDPNGLWYGDGVIRGVKFETGRDIPALVKEDMVHSTVELDNIFGTQPTFRGEGGKPETATGRAILREQSFQRLDELIDLVDNLHQQLYVWIAQIMKVRYTESHYVKPIGAAKARRVIELTRDSLEDGIEIQIIPGQIMPEDRLFRAERAKEEVTAGIIDPLTYFEETQRENPQELAKRLLMFKTNPFSLVKFSEEDIANLQQANQLLATLQPGGTAPPEGAPKDDRAAKIAEVRKRAEQLVNSEEFKALPAEEQRAALGKLKEQMQALAS